jgi:hypothetical protein
MWYYGLDDEHSFSRFHPQTRYNLLTMAYVWALDFPEDLCGSGEEIKILIRA